MKFTDIFHDFRPGSDRAVYEALLKTVEAAPPGTNIVYHAGREWSGPKPLLRAADKIDGAGLASMCQRAAEPAAIKERVWHYILQKRNG